MPFPDRTPPRELPRRNYPQPNMSQQKLGPAQEHDNLYATRNDVGKYSCVAMFDSIIRTLRAEPALEPCFKPGASDYMEKITR